MRILSLLLGVSSLATSLAEDVQTGLIVPAQQEVTLLDGFIMEEVFTVPKEWGSWVALANLPGGRIAAADQYGAIYEVTIEGEKVSVQPMDVAIGGAHGLLWHQDSLYVVVNEPAGNEPGVYRAQDLDGDGSFEKIDFLHAFSARGEHGIHSLIPSPDGEWLYLVAGNMSQDPKVEKTLVPRVWEEDQLLPRNADGRGHASQIMAPGGRVLRFRPDGKDLEYVSMGYRNPFDAAFSEEGDLFVYDADMEWDMGTPWYRPTRLCWALPGSEYGWRNGTGKWPSYSPDSLPSVVDFGPGSPVGVVSGQGAKFPAKYQRAIYCLDWTYATIYAVHLDHEGNGYRGEREEFLASKGFPVTDGIIGSDGAFYFATGGRKQSSQFWRVRYVGTEDTANAWRTDRKSPSSETSDRWSRFQERTALELGGISAVQAELGKGTPLQQMDQVMALARLGSTADRDAALQILLKMPWGEFSDEEKLTWLRATGLVFIRLGEATEADRSAVTAVIDSSFPHKNPDLEAELCRMLCYLQAPGIVARTLKRMAEPDTEKKENSDWARLVDRSDRYGKSTAAVLRELGSTRDMHFAYCLRVVKGPWTEGQRRQLMEYYAREEQSKAQQSAQLGLKKMREDTIANATEEEKAMIEGWGLEVKSDLFANLPRAKGPGRNWTVDEIVALSTDLSKADLANGKNMFRATLCYACHRVGTEGGAAGPDLTNVAGRFTSESFAIAVTEPSKEISDQYEFQVISKHDGSTVVGKLLDERDEILIVATNPFDFSETTGVSRADIKEMKPSPVSPMPGGLVNQLNEQEMRDLLGYLLGK